MYNYGYNAPSYAPDTTVANLQISNYHNRFMGGYIQDGKIFVDLGNGMQQVGITTEMYQSIEDTASQYRDRLIELGEIEIPLTQEQINEKLMTELKSVKEERTKLASILETIANKLDINEVKHGSEKYDNGSNTGNVTNDVDSNIRTGESE